MFRCIASDSSLSVKGKKILWLFYGLAVAGIACVIARFAYICYMLDNAGNDAEIYWLDGVKGEYIVTHTIPLAGVILLLIVAVIATICSIRSEKRAVRSAD